MSRNVARVRHVGGPGSPFDPARAALDLGVDTIVLSHATAIRSLPSVDRLLAGPAAGDS